MRGCLSFQEVFPDMLEKGRLIKFQAYILTSSVPKTWKEEREDVRQFSQPPTLKALQCTRKPLLWENEVEGHWHKSMSATPVNMTWVPHYRIDLSYSYFHGECSQQRFAEHFWWFCALWSSWSWRDLAFKELTIQWEGPVLSASVQQIGLCSALAASDSLGLQLQLLSPAGTATWWGLAS